MKILFLTTHFNSGGITQYVLTLTKGFIKKGHEVVIVSSGGDRLVDLEKFKPAAVHRCMNIRTKSELSPKIYTALPPLTNLIRHERIDCIHAQTRVTQVMGTFLGRLTKRPYVSTCHGFFRPRWSRRLFPAWGDAAIAISPAVGEHLQNDLGVAPQRVHVIANGIDLEEFAPASPDDRCRIRQILRIKEGPVMGTIARLSPVKGIDILIKAMPKVIAQFPSAKLLVVGQGVQLPFLKRLTNDLNLEKQVLFFPLIGRSREILGALDIFVMPSRQEGLGISVMEAQACAIPVIASKVGGLINLIDDGKTGLLVPVEQPAILAQALILLLKNPQKAKELAQEGRAVVTEKFSAEEMVNRTLKLYEEKITHHQMH